MELDYCVWAVSTSQLKEGQKGREKERSQAVGEEEGGGRGESWHFQTIISVELSEGLMSFLAAGFLPFSPLNKKQHRASEEEKSDKISEGRQTD